jgi:hypothetical protein
LQACRLAKESVPSITAFPFSKDGNYPTQIFTSCGLQPALAGNLDLGTAVILNQDDAGTLPNTGSIGCVTAIPIFNPMSKKSRCGT